MIDVAVTILVNECTIMVLLLMLRYVFGAGLRLNLKRMGLVALIYLILGTISYVAFGTLGMVLGVLLFLFAVFIVTGTRGRWKIFLYLIPALLLYNHFGQYTRLWSELVGHKEIIHGFRDVWMLVILLIWARQVERRKLEFSLTFGECLFICLVGIFAEFYFDVVDMIEVYAPNRVMYCFYLLAWIVLVTILEVCMILAIVYRQKHAYNKKLSAIYDHYFEEEYKAVQEKSERQKELDHLRHDWKNHVNTVHAMWQQGETTKAVEYVVGLAEEGKKNTYTILSGCQVADAILNLKRETAREAGIDFTFEGSLSSLSDMEPVDICVLLGNALDNAIEACGKGEKESYIYISGTEKKGLVLLTIENTLHEKIILRDNRPITTKKNPTEHGFGVLGMEHVVQKYHGDMRFEIAEELFKVQVMLPVQMRDL